MSDTPHSTPAPTPETANVAKAATPETATAEATQTETVETPASAPSWKRFGKTLGLAVIAGSVAAGVWHIVKLQSDVAQKINEQEETAAALDAAEQQSAQTRLQLEQQLLDLQRQLNQLQQAQIEQTQREQGLRADFDTRMNALQQTVLGRAQNMQLDEVEALLRRANAQSRSEATRDEALAMMHRAGRQLEGLQQSMNDPALTAILQGLKSDYDALNAHPRLDSATLTQELQRISDQIPALPLPTEMLKQIESSQDNAEMPQDWKDWRAWLSLLGHELKSLVRIRNLEDGLRPQLMAEDRFLLDQQIRLRLEQARLALLQRDAQAWSETLRSAQSSLHDYYDLNAKSVEDTLMALDALARTSFPDAAPTSPALQSLQQWRAASR
jgi:uroporphyrin-3 C-methyltransferase